MFITLTDAKTGQSWLINKAHIVRVRPLTKVDEASMARTRQLQQVGRLPGEKDVYATRCLVITSENDCAAACVAEDFETISRMLEVQQ